MRQGLVVSVWGAVFVGLAFVVLISVQSVPVGAQTDPLAGQTANITATYIGITVADCEADPNAPVVSVTVADAGDDAKQVKFTDDGNADFEFGSEGITITPRADLGALAGVATGTVVSSEGITCENTTGGNGGNGGAGGDDAGEGGPAQTQYGAVDDPAGVVDDTTPGKPLPKTGGIPLVLGAGVLLACATLLSVRLLRS